MAERFSEKLVAYTTSRANDSHLPALALGPLVE
jgi:hypothetical protein